MKPEKAQTMNRDQAESAVIRINHTVASAGELLLDFRDREGWRALEYESFRECCAAEFGEIYGGESKIYRLMQQAEVTENLRNSLINDENSPIGEFSKPVESVTRELAKVPAKEQAEVYQEAAKATGGKPTAAAVKKVATKRAPKPPKPAPAPKAPNKDEDFEAACDRILEVLGKNHADAVRKGIVLVKDLDYFVSLTPGKMKEVAELVLVSRWTAKSAVRFIDKPIDAETKLKDMMSHCIRGKGTFKCRVGKFEFTVILPK